jgi:3-oxoacyl-[acyl-carrier-protein] synthase II
MKAYIRSTGNISPQHTTDPHQFLDIVAEYESISLKCIEPDYKEFLNPVMSRRMGRIIKMGVAAAKLCLKNTGVEVPDAIITGTGLGCIEDTEKFLISILENDERLLPPTSFIQSTHNTVSAQIALELKCNSYNYTYVHRALSFESALLDALMQFAEREATTILLGTADEITTNSLAITSRFGLWKQKPIKNTELYQSKSKGSIAGEGAAFFLLGDEQKPGDMAKITAVSSFFDPDGSLSINYEITKFIMENNLAPKDIDLVIYGNNGDSRYDYVYDDIQNNSLKGIPAAHYKHLCGEYFTSSSFALWLAAKMISTQSLPDTVLVDKTHPPKINNILIYNQYLNTDHSFIIVSNCEY